MLLAVGLLIVLFVLAGYAYHVPVLAAGPRIEPHQPLAQAIERARSATLEPARDARTAVIRCYSALEIALTGVPALAPRPADSPSDVLDRAHRAGVLRSAASWRLVELFDKARFSSHPMSEPDRAIAEASLQVVLDELGSRR